MPADQHSNPAPDRSFPVEVPLADLAQQIASAHADALAAARTTVEHARRCGQLLLRVKDRLPHGQFTPWIERECPFGQRTAQGYMRVVRNWEQLQETLEGEEPPTIAGALQALAEPREAKAQPAALLDPEIHPLAATLFPIITPGELAELATSIARRGLQEPIVRYEGKVLDGRRRLLACRMAGVDPRYRDFHGDDEQALGLLVSLNVHRVHLTRDQQAAIAVELEGLER
jgi:hypothetical protein